MKNSQRIEVAAVSNGGVFFIDNINGEIYSSATRSTTTTKARLSSMALNNLVANPKSYRWDPEIPLPMKLLTSTKAKTVESPKKS